MSIKDYTNKFQTLEAKARMDIEDVREFYIANLRPEIRANVRMFQPQTLEKAIFYARQVEERHLEGTYQIKGGLLHMNKLEEYQINLE